MQRHVLSAASAIPSTSWYLSEAEVQVVAFQIGAAVIKALQLSAATLTQQDPAVQQQPALTLPNPMQTPSATPADAAVRTYSSSV